MKRLFWATFSALILSLPQLLWAGVGVSITKTAFPDVGTINRNLAYTIELLAGKTETNVVVVDALPATLQFISVTPSQGSCSGTSTITCNMGTLFTRSPVTVRIVVKPTALGRFTNTSSVASDGNVTNTASVTTIVLPPAPAPIITQLIPSSAPAGSPATPLTVIGSNFFSGAKINFNGTPLTTTFISDTEVRTTIPASALTTPGVVPVKVVNPDNQSSNTLPFTITTPVPPGPPAPVITKLTPNTAVAGSPDTGLVVTGRNFVPGATIRWNNAILPTTFVSSTTLTTTIPASNLDTPRTVSVKVVNPDTQQSNTLPFTVTAPAPPATPAPVLTRLIPDTAVAGSPATPLTVIGRNFVSGATIRWNGSIRPTTFVSSTTLTTLLPASDLTTPRTVPIMVVNPDAQRSNTLPFTVTSTGTPPAGFPAPIVTSLSPDSTFTGGPTFTLTVNGDNFVFGASVTWNGSSRATTFISSTQLKAVILASDITVSTQALVGVTNPDGQQSNRLPFTISEEGGGLPAATPCDLSRANPYPVPYKASSGLPGVTFGRLTNDTHIRIFSTDGRPVRKLESSNGSDVVWDMKNSDGENAASGVYFYFLSTSACDSKKNGKLVLIR